MKDPFRHAETRLLTLPLTTRLAEMKKHVYHKIATLDATYSVAKEPIPFSEKKRLTIHPIKKGAKWCQNHDCGWFHITGIVPSSAKNQRVSALLNLGTEGCLVDSKDNPVTGITNIGLIMDFLQPVWAKQEVLITELALGNEKIDLWIETGFNKFLDLLPKNAKVKKLQLVTVRLDVKALYYDYLSLWTQYLGTSKDDPKKESLHHAIQAAAKQMQRFEPENVALARKIIAEEFTHGEVNKNVIYATGHAHLDLAWLWPIRETKRKGARTFSNQLRNLESYEDYIFGASQPQLFQWMKEDYPALYTEIKTAIAMNRIEPQGGMWVECDTNLPCGESLIRQSLYGMAFWESEFGKKPTVGWLPDVFGFSGNLPQILKKCGMDYFLTIKLSWNEQNKWPLHSFIWEGIDNSSVIVHIPPLGNYVAEGNALNAIKTVRSYHEKAQIPVSAMLFGDGDGGGGPGEGHLESVTRAEHQAGLPIVKCASAASFFEDLAHYQDKMARHKGELYLEKHQGTYTTQARTKWNNRHCEEALHNVEFLSVLASHYGYVYPQAEIEKIWKEVLLYQFHDIIPGSAIHRVYVEAEARHAILLNQLKGLQDLALATLPIGKKLVAVNPTSFARVEFIKKDNAWYQASVQPYAVASLIPAPKKSLCHFTKDTLENDLLVVRFDKNGEIISLVTKTDHYEHCKDYLNRLAVYHDKKRFYNAWDIAINYTKKTPKTFVLVNTKTELDGPSVIRTNTYRFHQSKLAQKVILTEGKPLVTFETEVDWQETHKMLRADFIPTTLAQQVRCDIQFGNIMRSTKDETSQEKAQFEICAHKWVDVASKTHGFSLLNDSKYGHRVKNGLISLNLLRSSVYPDPTADRGHQKFIYALYPYEGGFAENNTQAYAYALNNPLIIAHGIEQPSLFSASPKNIVIDTIKRSEDGTGTILRLFENEGIPTHASVACHLPYATATETNMLEAPRGTADLSNLTFTAFEIKTILLKR